MTLSDSAVAVLFPIIALCTALLVFSCASVRPYQASSTLKTEPVASYSDVYCTTYNERKLTTPDRVLDFARAGLPRQLAAECLCVGVDYATYLSWSQKGFGCYSDYYKHYGVQEKQHDISDWISAGITDAVIAARYLALGVSQSQASEYRKAEISPLDLSSWRAEGVDPSKPDEVQAFKSFQEAGYTAKESIQYIKDGLRQPDQIAGYEHRRHLVTKYCRNHQVRSELEMFGNPYRTSGQCYDVLAFVVQWLGPSEALMNVDFSNSPGFLFLAAFSKPPSASALRMLVGGGRCL